MAPLDHRKIHKKSNPTRLGRPVYKQVEILSGENFSRDHIPTKLYLTVFSGLKNNL